MSPTPSLRIIKASVCGDSSFSNKKPVISSMYHCTIIKTLISQCHFKMSFWARRSFCSLGQCCTVIFTFKGESARYDSCLVFALLFCFLGFQVETVSEQVNIDNISCNILNCVYKRGHLRILALLNVHRHLHHRLLWLLSVPFQPLSATTLTPPYAMWWRRE